MGSPRVEKMLTTQDPEEITSTKNIIVSFFVEINISGFVHRPLYIEPGSLIFICKIS